MSQKFAFNQSKKSLLHHPRNYSINTTRCYKSEARSMPKQRLPKSPRHENALLCDFFINIIHSRPTQPCGCAWHSTHERPTTHTSAPEELHHEREATIQPILALPSFCVFSCWNLHQGSDRKKCDPRLSKRGRPTPKNMFISAL